MIYCNGTNWVNMGATSSIAFATLTTNDFCTASNGTTITCTTATINLGSQASGTLQAAQFPILTGDVTTTGSSLVTTVGSIGGQTVSLGGALTFSGAYAVSFTATGATNLTLPTSGTLLSSTSTIGTSQISGVVPVANGGTGASSQTANGVLYYNGTSITSGTGFVYSGGNVGIGTSNPGSNALQVNGNVAATSFSGSGAGLTNIGTAAITGVLPIANGGTAASSQTTNGIAYYNGTAITTGTGLVYSGGNVGIGTATLSQLLTVNGNIDAMGTNGYLTEIANNGTTATVLNKLAKLASGASTATVTTTSDTDGVIGIVVGGAGTTGNAQIAIHGEASCIFDGTTVAGDFVTISSTVGGDCHDTGGTTRSNTSQTIGRVMTVNSGTGTAATVEVALNGAGGGIPAGTTGQVQYNSGSSTFAASSNFTYVSANNELVVGTGAPTPVGLGTSGNVAAPVVNIIPSSNVFNTVAANIGGVAVNGAATGQMAYYSGASTISGTSNLYVSGSNIGIGTSSATNLLSLSGSAAQTIWMERGTSAGNNLTLKAGGGLSGGSNENGGNLILSSGISTGTGTSQIQFQTYPIGTSGTADNTAKTAMTVSSAGNVGIGTNAPTQTLHVSSSAGATILAQSGTTSTDPNLFLENSAGNGYAIYSGYNSNGNLYFASLASGSYSANLMTINSSGNVGIGTTSPEADLDVNGGGITVHGYSYSSGGPALELNVPNSNLAQVAAVIGTSRTNMPLGIWGNPTTFYATGGTGTPLMTILSSGNVGIGNTGPGATLEIHDSGTSTPALSVGDTSGNEDNGATYGLVNLTRAADTTKAHLAFIRAGNYVWQMGYLNGTNNFGIFPWNFSGTQGTPAMTFATSGYVGIGNTNPSYTLDISGTLRATNSVSFSGLNGGAGSYYVCYTTSLVTYNGSCGSSDARLKTNVIDLAPAEGLAAILKLRPVTFNWKDADQDKKSGPQIGFLAQEVKPLIPQVVSTNGNTSITLANGVKKTIHNTLSVDYAKISVSLVKAIQQLKSLFDADHDDIAKLKADNDNLRAELAKMHDNDAALTARLDALEAARR